MLEARSTCEALCTNSVAHSNRIASLAKATHGSLCGGETGNRQLHCKPEWLASLAAALWKVSVSAACKSALH